MAEPTGFLEVRRSAAPYRPAPDRIRDYHEVELPILGTQAQEQARRCMDCGIPFCHAYGCPVQNRIPEFNELVRLGRWREASENLHSTNNFPEFTGRTCPAPCEPACTLAINDDAVTIKNIENAIVERAWAEGWIVPQPPLSETGQRVAIVGSGPAGLAAAQQLRRAGHSVVVFEQSDRIGGLLRYGIPDFKLDKLAIDRRLAQLVAEGIEFQTGAMIGRDLSAAYVRRMFDAVVLAIGASVPRDLDAPGREHARNVHFAMEYLAQQNRENAGATLDPETRIDARGKIVAVIGGGDTGSDCVGTAIRQGAQRVLQLNYHEEPPDACNPLVVWPAWPPTLQTSSSHEEGCERRWSVNTTGFILKHDWVTALRVTQTEWRTPGSADEPLEGSHAGQAHGHPKNGARQMRLVPNTDEIWPVDLVLLACGFKHPEPGGPVAEWDLARDARGRLETDATGQTSAPGIFAAGDCVLGASLVVQAIHAGRTVAVGVERWLQSAHRRA
ncbi:MAG: glutamate synthase subunit beta [Phycisphaerales bacterium]|nr:glutamate synthase subunit beta [Phycisphaerales bacterium]